MNSRISLIYQVFVRSFFDADNDGKGDLMGLAEKLDYIQKVIGADTILLMPIFNSPSYHGYDVSDYYTIHPDYGTFRDFLNLVAEMHQRDMKIIIDLPIAHTSNKHEFFLNAYQNPSSVYSSWYRFTDDKNINYETFAGIGSMPLLNHQNPQVYEYFLNVALKFLSPDSDGKNSRGVDGFRCDYAIGVPVDFWKNFKKDIKKYSPQALLLGEVVTSDIEVFNRYNKDIFDIIYNYPLFDQIISKEITKRNLVRESLQKDRLNFLGNHDTSRAVSYFNDDIDKVKSFIKILYELPNPVLVYYGDEIGMKGIKGSGPYYDEYVREPMDWYREEEGKGMCTWFKPKDRFNRANDGISVEEQINDKDSLLSYYKKMAAVRKNLFVNHNASVGKKLIKI